LGFGNPAVGAPPFRAGWGASHLTDKYPANPAL